MNEMVKKSIRCALIGVLVLGPPWGVALSQEAEAAAPDIQNVLLTFHLVQADGFTDDDPEISDVATELRKLLSFQGYRLLSTSVLNIGLARARTYTLVGTGSQRIIAGDLAQPLAIGVEVSATRGSSETVRAKVTLATPAGLSPLLEASVTIRHGQRVVLGSARRTADEPVLILVVTPRIDPS